VVLGIVVLFLVLVFYQVPGMIRRGLWGELAAYAFFWVLGLTVAVAMALGMKVPNPTHGIEFVYRPLASVLEGFLKKP